MIDIYDKNGNRLLDLKKYTSKKEKIDKSSDKEEDIELYDKYGQKINDLKKEKKNKNSKKTKNF